MNIGMRYQKFEGCELACVKCGSKQQLCQVAHRNTEDRVIGYLFVCNDNQPGRCYDLLQKHGLTILGSENAAEK